MTVIERDPEATTPLRRADTGRIVWTVLVMIFSTLVLLLALGGIAGTWIGRGAAIETVTEFTTGVDQLAGVARGGVEELDTTVVDIREVVGEVQDAADQAAENVTDEGLLLTLLPQDTSQQLESLADRIRSTVDNVMSVLNAAAEMVDALRSLPFVDVQETEDVGAIRTELQAIRADVEQLAADVRQLREGAAAEITRVSSTAAQIDARLGSTRQSLAGIDGKLAWLQETANYIKDQFPTWITVSAVALTGILLWVAYGMVNLMRTHWRGWQASRLGPEARTPLPAPAAPIATTHLAATGVVSAPAKPDGVAETAAPVEIDERATSALLDEEE